MWVDWGTWLLFIPQHVLVMACWSLIFPLILECNQDMIILRYMNETFFEPTSGDKTNIERRTTITTPSVEHTLSEWKSLHRTRQNYCWMIKPGYSYIMYRRYLCRSCKNCGNMFTDPFTGAVQCEKEDIYGKWRKGQFIKKWWKWTFLLNWVCQIFNSLSLW